MNIDITGQNVDITDALRAYVTDKLARLERHSDKSLQAHVVLSVEKSRIQQAEATIPITGATLFANATDENMYAAIDALTDKLDRQLKKHEDKRHDHHNREARRSSLYSS